MESRFALGEAQRFIAPAHAGATPRAKIVFQISWQLALPRRLNASLGGFWSPIDIIPRGRNLLCCVCACRSGPQDVAPAAERKGASQRGRTDSGGTAGSVPDRHIPERQGVCSTAGSSAYHKASRAAVVARLTRAESGRCNLRVLLLTRRQCRSDITRVRANAHSCSGWRTRLRPLNVDSGLPIATAWPLLSWSDYGPEGVSLSPRALYSPPGFQPKGGRACRARGTKFVVSRVFH
jgi:hypothetical protein